MAIVRPSDITTERSSPVASEFLVTDNGSSVAKVTIANAVAAGRPLANQAEAEAGVNATKAMTPLTTKQAINAQAVLALVAGDNTTIDATDPQNPVVSYNGAGVTDGNKGDVVVSEAGTDWALSQQVYDYFGLSTDVRAELPGSLPAEPVRLRQWRAEWFGLVDHPSTDQTAVVQAIVDTKAGLGDEPVEVVFPAGTVAINNGGTNVPVELDGINNLTFKGGRETIFKKTVAERELFYGGRTNKCENIRFIGFQLDGGDIDDGGNDYPLIMMKWADDVLFDDLFVVNPGTALRVGFGDNVSSRPIARNCRIVNPRYHGIEFFYVDNGDVDDNKIEGGASSVGTSNRAIRFLKAYRTRAHHNRISNTGSGIALNTDDTRDNEYIEVTDNNILGCKTIAGIWSQYALVNSKIADNTIKCAGGTAGMHIGYIESAIPTRSDGLEVSGNTIVAGGSEADLIRIYGADNVQLNANILRHLGRGLATSHYAARMIACGGKNFILGNQVEMDDTDGRGIYDVSGVAGSQFVAGANQFMMASTALALQQSGSSGTLIKGGSIGDTNAYVTRT